MVQLILGLLAALAIAIAAILGLKNKNALLNLFNQNKDVIDKVKDITIQQQTNNVVLSAEEQKRADLQANVINRDVSGATQASSEELLRFLNSQLNTNKDKK